MGGRREDRLVIRLWESFFLSQLSCKDTVRRVNPAKKKGLTVTQQSLCLGLERGTGRAGFPGLGGRKKGRGPRFTGGLAREES